MTLYEITDNYRNFFDAVEAGEIPREAAACSCPSLLIQGSCAAEGVEDGETADVRLALEKVLLGLNGFPFPRRHWIWQSRRLH